MKVVHLTRRTSRRYGYWAAAIASIPIGLVLIRFNATAVYATALACVALGACSLMAVGDVRTGLLRNAWTYPFAAGAAAQVSIVATALPSGTEFLGVALLVLVANTTLYAAMGLMGWIGFGDVKFVVGLSLVAAATAGWLALLLGPLALITSSIFHLIRPATRQQRPHGPALTCSLASIVVLSLASGGYWS